MSFRSRAKAARRQKFRQLISESLESRNLFATFATFDHTPTPYIQTGPDNLQFTSVYSGGATGEYMKFMIGNKAGLQALSFDRTDGVTKMIIDPDTERVLGVGICGAGAGELIAEAVLAIEMGATAEDIALTVHSHPTLGETLMECAEVFYGHATHTIAKKKA